MPGLRDIKVERTPLGTCRLFVDENGMRLPSRLVSEGTLRVLGLLAITHPLRPLTFVGFEEPENGVHPRRLGMVARLLGDAAEQGPTQFLVNTHSPILPEHFQDVPGASLIHCRKEGRRTVFSPFTTTGPLLASREIEAALDGESPSPFRDRIVRGDFGG
ncbi:MAG TPA: AAA family ATPase [Gemmataceae bacterium]